MTSTEFSDLFARTKEAFDRSHVKAIAEAEGEQWHYSICSTRIVPGSALIVGFNWGAQSEARYDPQCKIPEKTFSTLLKEPGELGSFIRIKKYLETYLPRTELDNIGQTNYCFFRSRIDSQIKPSDLELCKPLFSRFLELAQPSTLLSFSSRLRDYLLSACLLIDPEWTDVPLRKGVFKAGKGKLNLQERQVPIFFLPHPNYPIKQEARRRAWGYCFPDVHPVLATNTG